MYPMALMFQNDTTRPCPCLLVLPSAVAWPGLLHSVYIPYTIRYSIRRNDLSRLLPDQETAADASCEQIKRTVFVLTGLTVRGTVPNRFLISLFRGPVSNYCSANEVHLVLRLAHALLATKGSDDVCSRPSGSSQLGTTWTDQVRQTTSGQSTSGGHLFPRRTVSASYDRSVA
jgi:hypothetical protein